MWKGCGGLSPDGRGSADGCRGSRVCPWGWVGTLGPRAVWMGVWPCLAPFLPAPLGGLLVREQQGPGLFWSQTPGVSAVSEVVV